MTKWNVNYDGWLVVEAENEFEADMKAAKILSESRITNDGVTGEWYVLNAEKEED